jgi:hypothetical protein
MPMISLLISCLLLLLGLSILLASPRLVVSRSIHHATLTSLSLIPSQTQAVEWHFPFIHSSPTLSGANISYPHGISNRSSSPVELFIVLTGLIDYYLRHSISRKKRENPSLFQYFMGIFPICQAKQIVERGQNRRRDLLLQLSAHFGLD